MKTLFDLADEINGLIAAGQGHLPIVGVVGSSGTAYEVGSVSVHMLSEEAAYAVDAPEGTKAAVLYLGS